MGRSHTDLPPLSPIVRDIGLVLRKGVPEAGEITALTTLLRRVGRPKGGEAPKPPSHGRLRKTYRYSKAGRRPGSKLTYLSHISSLSVTKGVKEVSYSVPADYVTIKEEEAIRRLSLFCWED